MAIRVRVVLASAVVGASLVGGVLGVSSSASAATARVQIIDNDGPTPAQGIDHRTGQWGFAPAHITVMKGEPVVFDHQAGNFRPHDVTSISNAGTGSAPVLEAGAKFGSGTAMEDWLRPGSSWTLDTNAVDPGHYPYFCSLHPWMVGTITVLSP
jgi:plastocyanin